MKRTNKSLALEAAEASRNIRILEGERAYYLELFGDALANREGYKRHLGMDALHYYLVQKHHWLPSQVRALNRDDLHFLFDEEMTGWTAPQVQKA